MKRLLAVLILMALAIAAHAEEQEIPQACKGRNLLAELAKNDPVAAKEIQAQADATPNGKSVLWKITPSNGAKPSFLMGTVHVTETRINTLSDDLKAKIAASKVVALELKEIATKGAMQAKIMEQTQYTRMPGGKTLWDVIPDDQEDKVRYNPLVAMMPPELREHAQPWMIFVALAIPLCEQLRASVKFTLDQTIAYRAQLANIPIVGLETIAQQLDAMSSLPMDDQVKILIDAAAPKVTPEDMFQTTIELYRSRNISAVQPFMRHLTKGDAAAASGEAMLRALLGNRNVTMAENAAPLIDKGEAFIAVGALHLPGDDGVVELLRQKGYKIEAVEESEQ